MHLFRLKIGLAAGIVSAAALAACQGSLMPPAAGDSARNAPAVVEALPDGKIPACSAARAPLPGSYVLLYADGNVKANDYTSLDAFWAEGTVETNPSPQPSNGPRAPRERTYLYSGIYRLKNSKQTGCAYVETTVSGKPLLDSRNNASFSALPNFASHNFRFDGATSGRLQIGSLHLSATGGHATLTLMLRRKVYDNGTLTFTERTIRNGP